MRKSTVSGGPVSYGVSWQYHCLAAEAAVCNLHEASQRIERLPQRTLAEMRLAVATIVATTPAPTQAQTEITEQEAHAIGVDAYLYFYPLVTRDITRRVVTNVEPGKNTGLWPTQHV